MKEIARLRLGDTPESGGAPVPGSPVRHKYYLSQ